MNSISNSLAVLMTLVGLFSSSAHADTFTCEAYRFANGTKWLLGARIIEVDLSDKKAQLKSISQSFSSENGNFYFFVNDGFSPCNASAQLDASFCTHKAANSENSMALSVVCDQTDKFGFQTSSAAHVSFTQGIPSSVELSVQTTTPNPSCYTYYQLERCQNL